MKGIRLHRDPGAAKPTLQYHTDLPVPSSGPGELVIQVHASPIQPSDRLNVAGNFPTTTFPRIPGRDFAGTVIEPTSHPLHGKDVYGTSGQHLSFTTDGAQAEYLVVPENVVALKPSNLSWAQAASAGVPFSTAYLLLERAHAAPGETVMVLGATGAVGSAVTQLAKGRGCRVLTVSRRDTTDINTKTDPDLKTADDLTNGKGPDVAVDTVGDLVTMHAALASLAVGGRLAVITTGASPPDHSEMSVDIKMLYRKENSIVGCNSAARTAEEMAGWLGLMKDGFEKGELRMPDEASYTKVKIEDAVGAYEAKEGAGKKFVIVFGED